MDWTSCSYLFDLSTSHATLIIEVPSVRRPSESWSLFMIPRVNHLHETIKRFTRHVTYYIYTANIYSSILFCCQDVLPNAVIIIIITNKLCTTNSASTFYRIGFCQFDALEKNKKNINYTLQEWCDFIGFRVIGDDSPRYFRVLRVLG